MATSDCLTPSILDACAKVSGLTLASFSLASALRFGIFEKLKSKGILRASSFFALFTLLDCIAIYPSYLDSLSMENSAALEKGFGVFMFAIEASGLFR